MKTLTNNAKRKFRHTSYAAVLSFCLPALAWAGEEQSTTSSVSSLSDKVEVKDAPAKPVQEANAEPAKWYATPDKPLQIDALFHAAVGWTDRKAANIDARPFFSVHRARLWFRGKVHDRVNYVLHLAFDRIGADEYAMLQAGPLGPARPLAVQDALVQYDVFGTKALRISAGFLRPNVGRESNTPVPAVGTHEPGLTSFLARRMTTGTGHGRAGGIDLGGRFENLAGDSLPLALIYHAGAFTPTREGMGADGTQYSNSLGLQGAPLFGGSLSLVFGSLSHMRAGDLLFLPNPWSIDWTVMLGGAASAQMKNDFFDRTVVQSYYANASAYGVYFDGEFVTAERKLATGGRMSNRAYHARLGYNIWLDRSILSPFAMYTQLNGDDFSSIGTSAVDDFGMALGTGSLVDAGFNWHFRAHKLRAGFHVIYAMTEDQGATAAAQPIRDGWSSFLTLQVQR